MHRVALNSCFRHAKYPAMVNSTELLTKHVICSFALGHFGRLIGFRTSRNCFLTSANCYSTSLDCSSVFGLFFDLAEFFLEHVECRFETPRGVVSRSRSDGQRYLSTAYRPNRIENHFIARSSRLGPFLSIGPIRVQQQPQPHHGLEP